MILSLVAVLGSSAAFADGLNPGQYPFSIFNEPDLFYMGSNTGTPDGVPCALEATYDNLIPTWFQTGGSTVVGPGSFCISIYPNDPSEVVNTSSYLSSSQKNYIYVTIESRPCKIFFTPDSILPAAPIFSWSDHLPGLTTGTANPLAGISMIKLQDSAISSESYSTIASALSAAGFILDKKGFWVNQCYGGPFVPSQPQ